VMCYFTERWRGSSCCVCAYCHKMMIKLQWWRWQRFIRKWQWT